tara:strand:- start:177 stop:1328 length:1152 start_codon:yes stop_codon:yes gene_type:complete
MSEVKQEEPVKQEGDFKIKSKTPRKFANENPNEVTKVNIKEPLIETPEDIVKVVIPKQDGIIQNEEPEAVPVLETPEEEFTPIKEVTEEEVKKVTVEAQEAIRDNKILGKALPENIEKLVSFMEEVPGATIEDYVRLNADYTNVADNVLLREYYLKTKPYLENDDVDLLLEDYAYDLDLDEDIDIRKKKLALKEEVAKAKGFLEETKSKYYDEIKLRPGVTQDQQRATEFFNRYTEDQSRAKDMQDKFKSKTKQLFNEDFKGFDFEVGEKKFRYGLQNKDAVAEKQSDINNFVGKFLDKEGNISDHEGYHKALYSAMNSDKLANHFYEQGKADAIRDVVSSSKNPSTGPRKSADGNVFINGLKVKAISGMDSSKLRIKTKKFN